MNFFKIAERDILKIHNDNIIGIMSGQWKDNKVVFLSTLLLVDMQLVNVVRIKLKIPVPGPLSHTTIWWVEWIWFILINIEGILSAKSNFKKRHKQGFLGLVDFVFGIMWNTLDLLVFIRMYCLITCHFCFKMLFAPNYQDITKIMLPIQISKLLSRLLSLVNINASIHWVITIVLTKTPFLQLPYSSIMGTCSIIYFCPHM